MHELFVSQASSIYCSKDQRNYVRNFRYKNWYSLRTFRLHKPALAVSAISARWEVAKPCKRALKRWLWYRPSSPFCLYLPPSSSPVLVFFFHGLFPSLAPLFYPNSHVFIFLYIRSRFFLVGDPRGVRSCVSYGDSFLQVGTLLKSRACAKNLCSITHQFLSHICSRSSCPAPPPPPHKKSQSKKCLFGYIN